MNPQYKKEIIGELLNPDGPSPMNLFSDVGDFNGDGLPDVAVCGRDGEMAWLENKGDGNPWVKHFIDKVEAMECGGIAYDLTGNGFTDVIVGGDWRSDEICWWQNPGPEGSQWVKRLVFKAPVWKFHDITIGDITGDGSLALVFTNQIEHEGSTIRCIPLPADPTVSPWPDVSTIATGKSEGGWPEEGLSIGDIDGDGKNELVCGTWWYKYCNGNWVGHKYAQGYITTKVAIGDVDGDGMNEIILSEGDPCIFGKTQGGKLSWFKAGEDITVLWTEHVIEDFLFDPHSLQAGDLCGQGRCDIFIGEVGVSDGKGSFARRLPVLAVYENDGLGNFKKHVIDEGTGTHNALLADMRHTGGLDIVGKPLHGPEKWNVHIWFDQSSKQ